MSENISPKEVYNTIYERVTIPYSIETEIILKKEKKIVLLEIEINASKKKSIIYDNQEECARDILYKFKNRKIISIMVIGLTQSGKTGTMISCIKHYVSKNMIPIDNIYIITGLSSNEWKSQTKDRMPSYIVNRVSYFYLRNV